MLLFDRQHRDRDDGAQEALPRATDRETGGETEQLLSMLGLSPGATWAEIADAHQRLVSDLTPGENATHRNVERAKAFLREVDDAFAALQRRELSA